MLEAYATKDKIAETDVKIMRITQPLNRILIEYAELPWARVLRCSRVYDEYILESNFIEAVQQSISQSMFVLGLQKHGIMEELARHLTSLTKLQIN